MVGGGPLRLGSQAAVALGVDAGTHLWARVHECACNVGAGLHMLLQNGLPGSELRF